MVTINRAPRRGVLLLVVLSVLTLFLMLGAAYIAVASRARKASRAFADNIVAATSAGVTEMRLLDEAFMAVARGTTAKTIAGAPVNYIGTAANGGDDLLGDKYGAATVKGRVSSAASVSGCPALLQLTCTATTGSIPSNVSDYAGRVVTLALPGLNTSTRILGASGAAATPTLFIAGGPTVTGETLSASRITNAIAKAGSSAATILINGREFDDTSTNEPYDGYDTSNPLLTRMASGIASGTAVMYSGTSLNVDNDGDGQADSAFLDIGLPPIIDSSGQTLYPQAAVLVLDLDGRLNVNAHGGATDMQTVNGYPTLNPTGTNSNGGIDARTVPLYQLPRGIAAGPADVSESRSLIFSGTTLAASGSFSEYRMAFDATYPLSGRTITGTTPEDSLTGRETPRIGGLEGRFGDGSTTTTGSFATVGAGFVGQNDTISRIADQWRASLDPANGYASKPFTNAPGRFGSPWDLKGRMRLWVDDFGQPVYFKPAWPVAGTTDYDVVDDPYEVNLNRLGSRPSYAIAPSGSAPADNIYTPAELEGLLRYYDPDSLKLQRRLAAMNESNASANRLLLTTESWDTPAVVGSAWQTIIGGTFSSLLSTSGLTPPNRAQDFFSPETIMGHKLDLNRPFHDTSYDEPNDTLGTARRQMFARHLYCLMMAIAQKNKPSVTGTSIARSVAQYAVNVVDYRDGDSIMTRFDFDPNFQPGSTTWTTGTNDYVWGCERPELLITETLAWHDRCTDDTSSDPTGKRVVEVDSNDVDNITDADDDFDQKRRPRGAFFVELYTPWRARMAEVSSGSTVILSGSNVRAEPVPAELRASGTDGFSVISGTTVADSTITLNKTVAGCPVWRLVSVRGDVEGGTAFSTTTKNILDPSAPDPSISGTAVVDRVFYFGVPSGTLTSPSNPRVDGKPGSIFWATGSASAEPSQSQYVTVGTYGLGFDYKTKPFTGTDAISGTTIGLSYVNTIHLGFDGPSTATTLRPATLSEPVNTSPSSITPPKNQDPYEVLCSGSFGPVAGATPSNIYDANAELTSPLDKPLDEVLTGTTGPVSESFKISNAAMIAADPTVAGRPLLMFNGTHENFAVLHLQRLADPTKSWDASNNPYITVDSMPVDLTVVNTDNSGTNYYEPGQTPYNVETNKADTTALTWLQTQKAYRYQSAERGGKAVSGLGIERDIWNRRVNATGSVLCSGTSIVTGTSPYVSGTVAAKDLSNPIGTIKIDNTTLLKKPTPAPATLIQVPTGDTTLTGTTDHTFRQLAAQTEKDSRPSRFEKLAAPEFPWLAWPNRPFGSPIDLALVPVTSPFDLTGCHSTAMPSAPTPTFFHLPGFFESGTPRTPWDAIGGRTASTAPSLFDFVHVPSPFAAIYTTVAPTTSSTTALRTLGLDIFPLNQISNYREPGRVNVNTIPDRRVWRALFGAANVLGVIGDTTTDDPNFVPAAEQPCKDRIPGWSVDLFGRAGSKTSGSSGSLAGVSGSNDDSTSPTRVRSVAEIFQYLPNRGSRSRQSPPASGGFIDQFKTETEDRNGNGTLDPGEDGNGNGVLDQNDADNNGMYDVNLYRNTDRHAYFRYQTMRQLSNIVTTRSNVYAVWITLRYVDSTGNEVKPVRRNRAFYIFDRSIPVAYEKGENHNVRDAILLRRVVQ